MKSNPSNFNPAKRDFTAISISSTIGGFHPSQTDLTAFLSVLDITQNSVIFLFYAVAMLYVVDVATVSATPL
ncbi:MAG: hypothetical protein IJD18_01570, partial [Clostridia bacterium]|nr:hypothetical protein [Clostridia bacterium]